jgi:hypothetical protein
VPETDVIRPRASRFALADMFRSLGLLVVVIAVLLFIGPARSLILPGSRDRMPAADYTGAVHGFDEVAHSPAVVPVGLPSGWRANAADVSNLSSAPRLHIGWAVPGTAFAGLDEGTGNPDALLRSVTGHDGLVVRGTTTIAGETWSLRRSDRGETVLTRDVNGTFVVITGNATDAQLRYLAASLH